MDIDATPIAKRLDRISEALERIATALEENRDSGDKVLGVNKIDV